MSFLRNETTMAISTGYWSNLNLKTEGLGYISWPLLVFLVNPMPQLALLIGAPWEELRVPSSFFSQLFLFRLILNLKWICSVVGIVNPPLGWPLISVSIIGQALLCLTKVLFKTYGPFWIPIRRLLVCLMTSFHVRFLVFLSLLVCLNDSWILLSLLF